MASTSGTSTSHLDLLDDLVAFATANGWTLNTPVIDTADTKTAYLRGPGSVAANPVHVQIQAGGSSVTNVFFWQIRAAPTFSAALDFNTQIGVSPATYLLLQNSTLDYWFFVSERSIRVVVQVSTTYWSAYAGFYLPFATPAEYTYPLYVAASTSVPVLFNTQSSEIRSVADPGIDAAWLRSSGGVWERVYNHNALGVVDSFVSHLDIGFYAWPYFDGGARSQSTDLATLDLRSPPDDPNGSIIIPIHLFGAGRDRGIAGILEDVYWVSGNNGLTGAEQALSIPTGRAEGTLTLTAVPSDAETVTIGFRRSATGQLTTSITPGLSGSGQPADGDTVTIGPRTYTFQDTLTDVDGNVHIGTDEFATMANLANAINDSGGVPGTDYAASTTPHPDVTAVATGLFVTVTSNAPGSSDNSLATTTTATPFGWSAPTLTGGTDPKVYTFRATLDMADGSVLIGASEQATLENLRNAINGGPGSGITYGSATTPNADITARAPTATELEVEAQVQGSEGNLIVTEETLSAGSWGGATLSGAGANETYRIFPNGNRNGNNHFFAVREA